MEQQTINQRIKILVESLTGSVREFSRLIEESPTNTANYIGPRNTEPRAQYLTKLLRHFSQVDARWLMTGEGDAFSNSVSEPPSVYQSVKKNAGNAIGINHGKASQRTGGDGSEDLKEQIAQLKSQLIDKERIIQLLEKSAK